MSVAGRIFARVAFLLPIRAVGLIALLTLLLPAQEALAQCATSGTNQTCVNTGFVSGGSVGIFDNNNLTVTNTGTIAGTDYGIFTFGNANVVNAGAISGGTQYGIQSFGDATVINSGTITSPGLAGLYFANNGTVVNSGTISGQRGIIGGGGGVLNLINSGTIIGTSSLAIDLTFSTGDTLTFLPGSRIVGDIGLGASEVVNIRTGHDIGWLLTFGACGCGGLVGTGSTANVTGGAPYVISGDRIATLDPTAFAAADRALADFTGNVSSLIGSRFGELGTPSGGAPSAFAPAARSASLSTTAFDGISALAGSGRAGKEAGILPDVTMADRASRTVAWSRGFVGMRRQEGDDLLLRTTSIAYGGAIGMDRQVRSDLLVGGFVGAGHGRVDVSQNSQTVGTDYVFGGFYGRLDRTSRFIDFAITGGGMGNRSSRTVANNLAPSGFETATASYDGWFISPEIAYGTRMPLGGGMTLTPTARLRYIAGVLGGYSEAGSAQDLSVASRTMQNLEERLELALSRVGAANAGGLLKTTVTLGLLGMQRLGDATVNTTLIGQNLAFTTPGKDAVAGLYTGLGLDWRASASTTLFAAFEGTRMTDDSITGVARGGFRIAF
jgi:hypothetical protein